MNILYYYPAASKHGAKTILHHYYKLAISDKKNTSYFFTSDTSLKEQNNVHVIFVEMNNIRILRRIYFDLLYIRVVIQKFEIDKVFNLQNILVPFIKTDQTLYFHQALIFIETKFHIFKNPLLWFYKNIYSKLVIYSIKKSTMLVVQTEHMKKVVLEKIGNNLNVVVETPQLALTSISVKSKFIDPIKLNLFYPTSMAEYKNYYVLFDAILNIPKNLVSKINFIITIDSDVSKRVNKYKNSFDSLSISNHFIGEISHEDVLSILNESVLVYPSMIESLGLPILEARLLERNIIAIDKPYTRELLTDYQRVAYFNSDNNSLNDLTDKLVAAVKLLTSSHHS